MTTTLLLRTIGCLHYHLLDHQHNPFVVDDLRYWTKSTKPSRTLALCPTKRLSVACLFGGDKSYTDPRPTVAGGKHCLASSPPLRHQ